MEYLDPKQKKSHEIKLYIGYGLMAVLVILATAILGLFAFGFNLDTKTGSVVQNGLLFIDSSPESSTVRVNNIDKGQTDVRLVVPSGKYKIDLSRDGYRGWSNEIDIAGGEIARIVYPFLFPSDLKSEDSSVLESKPIFGSQSPDRNWVITKYEGKLNEFVEFNLTEDPITPNVISLSPGLINQVGEKHFFKEVEWSTDNRHLLVRHDFEGGYEYIVVDREEPAKTFNLSNKYNTIKIKDLRFRDKKFDKYYILDESKKLLTGEFKKIETVAVAENVIDFQPHGNDIVLYVSAIAGVSDKVEVKVIEKEKQYSMRELPADSKYLIDLAEFDGSWYVVFGASKEQKVYIYIDPFKELKEDNGQGKPLPQSQLRLDKPIENLSFSANARFIAVQSGQSFAVYDSENINFHKYDIDINIATTYEAKWMDGHRFNVVSAEKVYVFDFDGTNKQELMSSYDKYYPFFDRDYNDVYNLTTSISDKQKSALVFTPLDLGAQQNN
jgi:hypothetical protein